MTGITEALMRRIIKIKALAEQGVGGEKTTAQAMLANILARHGLTLADLEDKPAREWVEVSFSGKHERTLIGQIIRKVTKQRGDLHIRQVKRVRSSFYVELSPVEHVEVEFMFEIMKTALAAEMDKALHAFIHANRLYGPSAEPGDEGEEDSDKPEPTPEERARHRQIAQMAMAMNPVNVRRAIKGE